MNDNSPWLGAQPVRRDWQASTELFPKDFSRFARHNGEPEALADLRANIERLEL